MTIHLIATVDDQRVEWLPQFVEHYRALGVDQFLISLHVDSQRSYDELRIIKKRTTDILATLEISLQGVLYCRYSAPVICNYQNEVQTVSCREGDWIVWCDIDEFQEYPAPLRDVIECCMQEGIVQVTGSLIDRLARGGELAPFNPSESIWRQYPMGVNVTEKILGGLTRKVAASRAGLKIGPGHHFAGAAPREHSLEIRIHHFKWDASVLTRLRSRLAADFKKRCPWWVETRNFYEHFEKYGRIRLEALHSTELGELRPGPDRSFQMGHRETSTPRVTSSARGGNRSSS